MPSQARSGQPDVNVGNEYSRGRGAGRGLPLAKSQLRSVYITCGIARFLPSSFRNDGEPVGRPAQLKTMWHQSVSSWSFHSSERPPQAS